MRHYRSRSQWTNSHAIPTQSPPLSVVDATTAAIAAKLIFGKDSPESLIQERNTPNSGRYRVGLIHCSGMDFRRSERVLGWDHNWKTSKGTACLPRS